MYLRICPVRIWSICLFRLWVAAPVVHLVERHGFIADAVVTMLVCYEFPVLNIIFDRKIFFKNPVFILCRELFLVGIKFCFPRRFCNIIL